MNIFLILAALIAVPILYFRYKVNHFMDHMSPEQRAEWENALNIERERIENAQAPLKSLVVYRILQNSIHDGMTLEEMIDAFARMCETSVGDPDDLLFETGTFNFTGEKLFYFSLVRQFKFLSDDEYVQLRLDVTYSPSIRTALLFKTKWDSQVDGDFFEMVKTSSAFAAVKDATPVHAEVQITET